MLAEWRQRVAGRSVNPLLGVIQRLRVVRELQLRCLVQKLTERLKGTDGEECHGRSAEQCYSGSKEEEG